MGGLLRGRKKRGRKTRTTEERVAMATTWEEFCKMVDEVENGRLSKFEVTMGIVETWEDEGQDGKE